MLKQLPESMRESEAPKQGARETRERTISIGKRTNHSGLIVEGEVSFKPLRDGLLVRPHEDPLEWHGLALPVPIERATSDDPRHGPFMTGTVLAVGPGRYDKKGRRHPCESKVGDVVGFTWHKTIPEITINGEKLYTIYEQGVIGHVNESETSAAA